MTSVKILAGLTAMALAVGSCNSGNSLEGKWRYAGGIYDGKKEGSTQGYQLERNYTKNNFEAFMIEDAASPEKYQAGSYEIKGDQYTETETFSTQPSKLTNVPVAYTYHIKQDSLILSGVLPTGMKVEEYWLKVK